MRQANSGNRHRVAIPLSALLFMAAVLTPAAHAQPFPESERQKAAEAQKKADEKANDEAYKATLKHTRGAEKPVDPWGNLRAAPADGNK